MAQTASPFAPGSDCVTQEYCGAGILNAFGAVKAAQAPLTQPVVVRPPWSSTTRAGPLLRHGRGQEITPARRRCTLPDGSAPATSSMPIRTIVAGFAPVCRFYIPPAYGDSHFYSGPRLFLLIAAPMQAKFPFHRLREDRRPPSTSRCPTSTGACPAGTSPVYRVWDNRADTNHRYMTSACRSRNDGRKGWIAEGYGPNQVIMCAPRSAGRRLAAPCKFSTSRPTNTP